jgi:hypothetical protein
MFGREPFAGGRGKRPPPAPGSVLGGADTAVWMPSGADPVRNSTIQSVVSVRTSSVTSSENRRSTPRHRSAASPAVPSAGPSTSRMLSEAQSNWNAWSRRATACAARSSARQPQGATPCATPVRSSTGRAAPAATPVAAPTRSRRAPRRFHTRSRRYQAAVRRAPRSAHRYSSSSRSAGSPQSPSGKGRPVRSPGRSPAEPSPRPS